VAASRMSSLVSPMILPNIPIVQYGQYIRRCRESQPSSAAGREKTRKDRSRLRSLSLLDRFRHATEARQILSYRPPRISDLTLMASFVLFCFLSFLPLPNLAIRFSRVGAGPLGACGRRSSLFCGWKRPSSQFGSNFTLPCLTVRCKNGSLACIPC